MAKEEKMKRIQMVDYDVLIEKNTYPRTVYDPKTQRSVQAKETVETMKRYNKNVTYSLPASIADRLLGRKTAVLV